MVLGRSGLNRKITFAVAELSVTLSYLHLDAAQLPVPLLVLGIVTNRVGSFVVGHGEHNAILDLVVVEVGFAASLGGHFFHGALDGYLAVLPTQGPIAHGGGVAVDLASAIRRALHPAGQAAETDRVDGDAGAR